MMERIRSCVLCVISVKAFVGIGLGKGEISVKKRLEGKVAIVTGAGSGIGKAVAVLFASEGAKVAVAEINEDAGEKTVEEIKNARGEAIFIKADVTKEADCANMIKATVEQFGKLNILFNNVGTGSGGTVVDATEEYWDKIMNWNLKPTFFGSKYAIPEMIKAGGGSIINMASIGGLSGQFSATFCASKGAVVNLTRSMAVVHAKDNVRVNC